MIKLNDIVVKFGDFTALHDINVHVKEGEFFTFLGPSGCGKTTTLRTITGFIEPVSGSVFVKGRDITHVPIEDRNIGIVFQSYALFPTMTVYDNIAFGLKVKKVKKAEIDKRVRYAMDCVHLDYDKYSERSPFELSGGQMRRVAIAGVLAMKPSVLILDEPTAGLDPRGRDRILGMLEELHARENVTILMVSHSMDDMARLASRLIVMSDGKVVADGTPREIFMQEEMMTSIGLDIPEAARLCARLRAKGYDLPADLFRPEQLKEQLLRIWKEGSAC